VQVPVDERFNFFRLWVRGCIQVVSPWLALRQAERRYYLCRIGKDEQAARRTESAPMRHNPVRGITTQRELCGLWLGRKITCSLVPVAEANVRQRCTVRIADTGSTAFTAFLPWNLSATNQKE
jgi:hypothetical protein